MQTVNILIISGKRQDKVRARLDSAFTQNRGSLVLFKESFWGDQVQLKKYSSTGKNCWAE